MKKHYFPLLLLWLSLSLAHAQSIHFQESFEEALVKAQKTGKLVFIDFYATWCGPCKMMDMEVFSEREVYQTLNNKFINLKLDVDTGGKSVAKQYAVTALPTLMVVDGSGTELVRVVGYIDKPKLLRQLSNLFEASFLGQHYADMKLRWSQGQLNCEEMGVYLKTRKAIGEPTDDVLDGMVMRLQSDTANAECAANLVLDNAFMLKGTAFEYLYKRKEDGRFTKKLRAMVEMNMKKAIAEKDESAFESVLAATGLIDPAAAIVQEGMLSSRFYLDTKQQKAFANWAETFIPEKLLHRVAVDCGQYMPLFEELMRMYIEHIGKEKALLAALGWSENALGHCQTPNGFLFSARLQLKLGNKDEANTAAEKAMNLAKTTAANTAEIEKLLAEINR